MSYHASQKAKTSTISLTIAETILASNGITFSIILLSINVTNVFIPLNGPSYRNLIATFVTNLCGHSIIFSAGLNHIAEER